MLKDYEKANLTKRRLCMGHEEYAGYLGEKKWKVSAFLRNDRVPYLSVDAHRIILEDFERMFVVKTEGEKPTSNLTWKEKIWIINKRLGTKRIKVILVSTTVIRNLSRSKALKKNRSELMRIADLSGGILTYEEIDKEISRVYRTKRTPKPLWDL